ncbi:MAG TPA: HD domain-containing phosphohydrolase [Solirubrobacterales bacterium]|jgi:putative two-component system response regulator|nr:HD domain-containing phosphohydrolase [Solirubrobacterales bacterium]
MGIDPTSKASIAVQGLPLARILVTDDQPAMLDLMDRALGDTYECEFASSVAEARRHLETGAFQLAICNFESDGSSGLGLAGEIVDAYPQTATIVLMTGEDDPEAARQAFAHGVYGYLVEPFWPGQLLITVMNTLRGRDLEIAARAHSQNLEDRRQTIIDMAPIGIYAKDVTGHYVVSNDTADLMAGMESDGLLGKTDEAFLSGDALEVGRSSFDRVIEDGVPHERVDTVEIAGLTRTFKTIRFPLLGEDGEINAVGGISVDITAECEALRLRDELTATQQDAIEALRLSRQETIEGLAKAINLHDSSTGEHVDRMAAIASFLATLLGFDPDRALLLRAAAPMHDVGKIGVSAELLRKPGPLSAEERSEMERHTVVGHEIFAQFESDLSRTAASIALTHHERFDGSGYPQGLAGEEIPLEGRITAVADVFDAILSDRSYRTAMSVDEAVEVMKTGRGSQFDPEVVDALLGHLDEALARRARS